MYRKEFIVIVAMTKSEKDSGNWPRLLKLIKGLSLQELLYMSLILDLWRGVFHAHCEVRIDETCQYNIEIFSLTMLFFALLFSAALIELFFPVY